MEHICNKNSHNSSNGSIEKFQRPILTIVTINSVVIAVSKIIITLLLCTIQIPRRATTNIDQTFQYKFPVNTLTNECENVRFDYKPLNGQTKTPHRPR